MTAFCCVLETASGKLSYVNCGHNPPLLLHGSGGCETLRSGGTALGLFAGERYRRARSAWSPATASSSTPTAS